LAAIVQAFEGLAVDVINFAAEIGAFVNEILRDEFQKRIDALNQYAAQFVSLAGGLADVANLAAGAGLGIKTFSDAVLFELENLGFKNGTGGKIVKVELATASIRC
jgi:hypothetical protein